MLETYGLPLFLVDTTSKSSDSFSTSFTDLYDRVSINIGYIGETEPCTDLQQSILMVYNADSKYPSDDCIWLDFRDVAHKMVRFSNGCSCSIDDYLCPYGDTERYGVILLYEIEILTYVI